MGVGTMRICEICQESDRSFPDAAEGGFGGNPRRIGFPPAEIQEGGTALPLLLSTTEVGALLGIGRTKIFEMLASGELSAVRIGRCVRISRDQLETWIDGKLEEAGLTRRLPATARRRASAR